MNNDNTNYTTNQLVTAGNKRNLKIVIIILVFGLLIFGLFKLLSGSNNGSLVVNSNVVGDVSISAYPNLQPKVAKITNKTYETGNSISLPAGTYRVSVTAGDGATAKIVDIKSGEESFVNLNVQANPSDLEPVGNIGAVQLSASRSQIIYLDSRSDNLYRVTSNNSLGQLSPLAFSTVRWANSTFGVGQDTTGTLFYINNGVVTTASNLPSIDTEEVPSFAVAPNRTVYVAYGRRVFMGRPAGQFKLIYTANTSPVELAASNGHVAVVASPNEEQISDTVAIVSTSGSNIKKSDFGGKIVWSPSGRYFFANSDGPDQIYDSNFGTKFKIPSTSPQQIVWYNEQTIYYSEDNQLWQYTLAGGETKLVGVTPDDESINYLTLSDDKSYVYLTTQSTSGDAISYNVYRYGLNGQRVSDSSVKINGSLPWLTDSCLFGLVNFTRPTIIIGQGNNFSNCINTARQYVNEQGINPNQFDYKISNVLPSTPTNQ